MRCTLFVCTFHLFLRYGWADHDEGTKHAILDVTNTDSSSIDTFTRNPYGMVAKIHIAKDGYRILSVWDGQDILWISANGYLCDHVSVVMFREKNGCSTSFAARLVAVYASNSNDLSKIFYYENVGGWKKITEERFYRSFSREASNQSLLGTIVLNINGTNDPSKLYMNSSPNFPFSVYAPNVGYGITSVQAESVLWMGTTERCLYASSYPRNNPQVIYLIISSENATKELFFCRVNNEWISTTKNEYRLGLVKAGFKEYEFSNEITAEISNLQRDTFYIRDLAIEGHAVRFCMPCVGLRLRSVVDNGDVIWKASEESERCTYLNLILRGSVPVALFIFVDDTVNARKILYFKKDIGGWNPTDKDGYYYALSGLNRPIYTHKATGEIIMSSFKNRQGLRIATYASRVKNAKGDVILVHGIRGHFMSEFCASSTEWNYRHFGYDLSPAANPLGYYTAPLEPRNADRYRHFFERLVLHGNLLDVSPRYEYEGSFVEALNRFGYNVYGFDHQSHGLSEANGEKVYQAENFKHYVYDTLQFISIVKRGKFDDPSEKWDKSSLYENIPTDRRTFLLGFSMGGNIVFRAVQEFHGNAEKGAKFLDGIIVTSGMFNVSHYLNTLPKKLARPFLGLVSSVILDNINPKESFLGCGRVFDLFARHHDPFLGSKKLTLKTTKQIFDACDDVKESENMVNYPRNLPTLFIHTTDDYICGISGPIEILERIASSEYTKLIELSGSLHYITAAQPLFLIKPHIKEWLEQYT
ncbi:hypothetical protein BEWA_009120 [Theileria equi strain WA]|uniref:Serine aminopeptidase S33 domain-containing protein n=1 Tax=Theileria equi strain WA TaxID=1537102 RepID=L0B105_THEEQ|nr:hypothetical protein BEWA_009120 [Theileria equi strain WA]AFZ81500.1 hypothetical protein BEWA_009120 [Theileria equi strain WA]|eukprot:XP_004831166.1 hypothetical protein BEWA_009120 [Theileria equi strain WA]